MPTPTFPHTLPPHTRQTRGWNTKRWFRLYGLFVLLLVVLALTLVQLAGARLERPTTIHPQTPLLTASIRADTTV